MRWKAPRLCRARVKPVLVEYMSTADLEGAEGAEGQQSLLEPGAEAGLPCWLQKQHEIVKNVQTRICPKATEGST